MRFLNVLKKIGLDLLKKLYSLALNILLLIIFIIIISFIAMRTMDDKEESKFIKKYFDGEKVVELSFPYGIREEAYKDLPYNFGGIEDRRVNLYKTLQSIDNMHSGEVIILKLDELMLSAVHRDELIESISRAKKREVKVYAYGSIITKNNYELAILADKIGMPPLSSTFFELGGYYNNFSYYKDITDTLGINFEVINIGDFKTYGERYKRDEISPELESEIRRIYDYRYNDMVKDISVNRGLGFSALNENILDGDYISISGIEAKKEGLIDELKYYDNFLKDKNINSEDIMPINKYYNSYVAPDKFKKDRIAVIYAQGSIKMRESKQDTSEITPENISNHIERAAKDPNIKGIVLRVNSPGGSALASQLILKTIKDAQKNKPVYISMGDVAASGGYYLSCQADKIYANEMTVTGSIGVVILLPKVEELTKKIGVSSSIIKKGKYTGIFDFKKNLTEKQREVLEKSSVKIYDEFKKDVEIGRGISNSKIEEIAQGKIWLGVEAKENGLIDEIGGLDATIKGLAKDLDLEEYSVIEAKKDYNYGEYIRETFFNTESEKVVSQFLNRYNEIKLFSRKPLMISPYQYLNDIEEE